MTIASITGAWRAGVVAGLLAVGGCATWFEEPDFDLLPLPAEPVTHPPPSTVAPIVIHHGARDVKRVALTFDACATKSASQYDERITKILVEENVPATIFLGGKWMEEHPEQTRQLAALPQLELANHSYLHPHMTKVSEERLRRELQKTQEILQRLTGRQATLFRAPYGEINERVVKFAADAGLKTVQFDLPAGDADKGATKEKLTEYVGTVAKNGSIVVMHINGRGWHTAEALPQIIAKLRQRGFEFVTVSELMTPISAAPATVTATPEDPPLP